MAAFSIFTRDMESAEDIGLDSEPSLLNYGPQSAGATERPLDTIASASSTDVDSPGPIVLRLPDLAEFRVGLLPSWRGPHLFWVAIVLGGLVAAVLIFGGGNPAPQEIDEAPVWHGESPWRQSAPIEVERGPKYQTSDSPYDEPGMREQTPPEIRAARREGTSWDSGSPTTTPGVATPVGTIITGAPE